VPAATKKLRELIALKQEFDGASAARRTELLRELERARLPGGTDIAALHEALCYSRAYPDNEAVLELVERMLGDFQDRPDLRRHRAELADTGIAGTKLHFRFYWLMAIRVAHLCPEQLSVDWSDFENKDKLPGLLSLLMPFSESVGLDAMDYPARDWIDILKGTDETDAAFLIRRFDALKVPTPVREKIYEDLDIPMVLAPGPATPARGREKWPDAPVVFGRGPRPGRPDLRRAIRDAKIKVRNVDRREARRLIDLANACMVTRHRDLLVFLHADENDVRLIDCGDGLQFACMGAVPERRLMLECVYGFLTLQSGVPIGYVLCSAFFRSSEIAYNVFETYRGTGTAHVYGCVLAMVNRLFGSDTFSADPYQLGHNNAEGLASGAWWFYYKLGFRPHDAGVRKLVREELAAMKADPGHRTSRRRLNRLASEYMFFHTAKTRRDVLGHIDLGAIGAHVTAYLANRFGADREAGLAICADETAKLLSLRSKKALSRGERVAWDRWAPLVLALPDVQRWTPAERRALRDVVRAKGGPRESEFVRLFDRHKKLRAALLTLSRTEPG